jgi:hypothetical protein
MSRLPALLLSPKELQDIYSLMLAALKDVTETDPQRGLFNVWDYLEECGYPTHEIQDYIEVQGDFLVNRALLMEVVEL